MNRIIIVLSVLIGLAGCSIFSTSEPADPVDTGEIIGYTYLITKKQLSNTDRENVEQAYGIFKDFITSDFDYSSGTTVKMALYDAVDRAYPDEEDAEQKAVINLLVSKYWYYIESEYNIGSLSQIDQMDIIKQVFLGIERGLGR